MIWLESGVSVWMRLANGCIANGRNKEKREKDEWRPWFMLQRGFLCRKFARCGKRKEEGWPIGAWGLRNEAVCMSIRTNKKQHFDTNEGPATVCHVPCKQEGTVASKNIDTHTYTLTWDTNKRKKKSYGAQFLIWCLEIDEDPHAVPLWRQTFQKFTIDSHSYFICMFLEKKASLSLSLGDEGQSLVIIYRQALIFGVSHFWVCYQGKAVWTGVCGLFRT